MKASKAQRERVLRWYADVRRRTVGKFLALLFDQHPVLVLKGGGGSGKSIFAGQKIIERCAAEPKHKILVVRKVKDTLAGSCFEQLCAQVQDMYPEAVAKIVKSPMEIRFRNGSRIVFAGLDDVEKLKSIYHITSIWIEEATEILEGDYDQLRIRLRDACPYYKQIILTFNPVSVTHWIKRRFFDREDPDVMVSESTYLDNPFLPEEARKVLEGFRDTDEYYYMVYCLGQWGVTGKTVFNARKVSEQLSRIPEPVRAGYYDVQMDDADRIVSWKWVEDRRNPLIRIYREPERGMPYVIGGDTAGDGSDRFVGQCLDNVTGMQCASLRMVTGEHEFVRQMYCMGMDYNRALVGIEANFSTFPNNEMQRLRYPRLYVRQDMDQYTHRVKEAYGFMTTKLTRNSILARLIRIVEEETETILDRETLGEMLTFVRNEDFRAEAQDGAHDDCVMALAIAEEIRGQQRSVPEKEEAEETVWTADMWEDYRNASDDEKRELIRMWGRPKA